MDLFYVYVLQFRIVNPSREVFTVHVISEKERKWWCGGLIPDSKNRFQIWESDIESLECDLSH